MPTRDSAHQTVTRSACRGRWWSSQGFSGLQQRMFWLFADPERWKWASSSKKTSVSSGKPKSASHAFSRVIKSRGWSSWTTANLKEWKFHYSWRIRLTERADNPRADECLRADRWGDLKTNCLTASMFWGDLALRERPGFFFFTSPVSLKFFTHETINCWPGTRPRGQYWNVFGMHVALRRLSDRLKTMLQQRKRVPTSSTPWCSLGFLKNKRKISNARLRTKL